MGVEGVSLHKPTLARVVRAVHPGQGEAPVVPGRAAEAQGMPPDRARAVAEEARDRLAAAFDRQLRFRVHEETGRVMVQVIDRESGEVVDEIPPEELLDLAAELARVAGLILDKRL